jgi:hypothetical protein
MMGISIVHSCSGGSGSRSASTPEAKNRGPWLRASLVRPHHPRDFCACPPDLSPSRRVAGGQEHLTAKGD